MDLASFDNPYILEETDDFAVVFKPPKTHSESRKGEKDSSILDWYRKRLERARDVDLTHRLDYETHGLVLFAKNRKSFLFIKDSQSGGEFVKEYSAVCLPADGNAGAPSRDESLARPCSASGFPPCPLSLDMNVKSALAREKMSFLIESYFRPYGPGRKLVRPVIEDGKKHREVAKDRGGFYQTEIVDINRGIFTARIKRGFRHQIRCHLRWIGFPILNDPLYSTRSEESVSGALALRAHALYFTDPSTGEQREYHIPPLR